MTPMATSTIHTILGSTGNIGTALATELSKNPVQIRLVSRNPKAINANDELVKADLLNSTDVEKAVAGSSVVYLVTDIPYNVKTWQEQWPVIMENVLNACKKYGARLVFFDNMYAYDPKHVGHLTEETPMRPEGGKGKVRAKIAQMVLDAISSSKLTAMIVRAADFYGPGAKLSFLHEIVINRMLAGKTPQWLYSGSKKHSFTYIPDCARAMAELVQHESAWNQVWHLPTSNEYPSGQEIVDMLAKELNMSNKLMVVPAWMVKLLGVFTPILKEVVELRYQLDQDYCFDSSKIEKAYGLKPTDIQTGLKACLKGR